MAKNTSDSLAVGDSETTNVVGRAEVLAIIELVVLSAAVAIAVLVWEGHVGYNLWDEGFLWYGIQRVLHGEVPIRDFMAYDPGRYYWSAAVMALTNSSGIFSLRVTVELFSWIGVVAGALLIYRSAGGRDRPLALLAIMTLFAWMYPWFKVFDNTIPLLLTCALAYLLQRPSPRSFFITGFSVGMSAVFGRNHGVYGAIACCEAIAFLTVGFRPSMCRFRDCLSLAVGVLAGITPLLAMFMLAPGFGRAFVDSVRVLIQSGVTNLPLPVPYPWSISFAGMTPLEALSAWLLGAFFIGIILIVLLGYGMIAWKRWQNKSISPELAAAILVAAPYVHYAYSRADVVHLAVSVTPFLIVCFSYLTQLRVWKRYSLALLLSAASILVAGPMHPGWQCTFTVQCSSVAVGNENLQLDPVAANDVALLKHLVHDFAPNGQSFVVTPYWPGAYALFGRKSPMWANYALWPRSNALQLEEIERIQIARPEFLLILNLPLDGREELRFSHTNPLINRYIQNNFHLLKNYGPDPVYEVYVRK